MPPVQREEGPGKSWGAQRKKGAGRARALRDPRVPMGPVLHGGSLVRWYQEGRAVRSYWARWRMRSRIGLTGRTAEEKFLQESWARVEGNPSKSGGFR